MIAVCWIEGLLRSPNILMVEIDHCIRTDYEKITRASDGAQGIIFYNLTEWENANITVETIPIPRTVRERLDRGEITELDVLHAIKRGD